MANDTIQQIAPDITLRWLHDNQIALFTLRTLNRDSLAAWFEAIKAIIDQWSPGRPLFLILDNNFPGSSFTPALRDYGSRVAMYRPDVELFTAVILPRTLMSQIVNTFLKTARRPSGEARIYSTLDEAVSWMQTKIIPEKLTQR